MRFTKNTVIAALATIVIIDEAVIIPLNNRRSKKALERSGEVIIYLGSLLDENGVQLTEFDKIAMTTMSKQ